MISETYATMKPRRRQAQNKEGRSTPKAPDPKNGLRRVLSHRQQQRNQTYAHGDMPQPRNAGDGCVQPAAEAGGAHLRQSPQQEAQPGHIQPRLVDNQRPADVLLPGKANAFSSSASKRNMAMPSTR